MLHSGPTVYSLYCAFEKYDLFVDLLFSFTETKEYTYLHPTIYPACSFCPYDIQAISLIKMVYICQFSCSSLRHFLWFPAVFLKFYFDSFIQTLTQRKQLRMFLAFFSFCLFVFAMFFLSSFSTCSFFAL